METTSSPTCDFGRPIRFAARAAGFLAGIAALAATAASSYESSLQELTRDASLAPARKLHRLFELNWEQRLRDSPEMATQLGRLEHNDRWTDYSLDALDRRKREARSTLEALRAIDRGSLSTPDRLNYDLFLWEIERAVSGARFPEEWMPITQLRGVHQDAAQLLVIMPAQQVAHYEAMLARLERLPALVQQVRILLERGLEHRVTPPRVTLRDVPRQVRNQWSARPEASPLLKPFQNFPPGMPAAEQERLRSAAVRIYRERVVPAFQQLEQFLEKTYVPNARATIAATELPDGEAWYEHRVRSFTTTQLKPREIHEIGLQEVRRIRSEMEQVIRQSGFRGDFQAFCRFLRTDKRFYYSSPEALLQGYRDIAKRADPELVRLFGTLPRLPYGILPVPAYAEKSQTTAYYQPGSPAAGRPGYFFANTYNLKARPKWEMEALTLHEAVPGHHLQIALAQELSGLPEFRKHSRFTAYVEGWGLYSESLGTEMGFYRDPYSKFGQLTYEMWRAIRLVVDTGMHALGWTREQAIEFFKENSSKTEHDIVVEIDRYIVWPGQALAYKLGELEIQRLRREAERRLGGRFDLRHFHDHLLGEGALPLELMTARMEQWIRDQEAGSAVSP